VAEQQRTSGLKSLLPRAVRRSVEHTPRKVAAPRQPQLQPMAPLLVQPKLAVGGANDPFEREADRTADAVMAFDRAAPIGAVGAGSTAMSVANRAVGKGDPPTKKAEDDKQKLVQKDSLGPGPAMVPTAVETSIERMSAGGGSPLPASLRAVFEPRFGYAFSDVRLHTGNEAASAARALGARAFTVGDNVFFGAGEYQPSSHQGQRLIAHELTHTIQQKPAAARAARTIAPATTPGAVPLQAAPQGAQRWLEVFDDPKASIRNKVRDFITRDFPPWDLITLIIGWDPIQERPVKGATRDWIKAAMKLAPDGEALFAKLEGEGKIESVAKWWDTEIAKLNLTYASIVALAKMAWDAVSPTDVINPLKAFNEKIKPIFEPTVKRVWVFIKAVGEKILQVVKDLVLGRIAEWAQQQKGYPLLCMVLGKDPVTGVEVKRTVKGLIFAVLDLVPDGEKIKENLEKSKTIEKASAWFSQEVKKLDLTWEGIKALFKQAWDVFKVAELLTPKLLLEKMAAIFGPPVVKLLTFLLAVGKKVLEFIFEGAMLIAGPIGLQIAGIFRKIGATFNTIVADPVAFVGHLVDGVKKGIQQFAKNIWEHLKTGLIGWLVGSLEGAGLVLPKVWDLKGIVDLVLQVLGISYAKIRVKLVKVLGEKTVGMLETAFAFLKTLVTEGPAAAWQQIVEAIGSLWDMVIGGIKDWAVTNIVTAAITKLATMFNPAGAVIQAIIATYNTVAFFIERIKQIVAFVEAVVDSIANIASGKIAQAANWIETAMARTLPVILGFLARLIGLGNVSESIAKVISKLQEKVDKGIDAVIDWVVKKAKSLFGSKDEKSDPKWDAGVAGVTADIDKMTPEEKTEEGFGKRLAGWKTTYGFTELTVSTVDGEIDIEGAMSPGKTVTKVSAAKGTPPVYGSLTNGYGTSVKVAQMGTKPSGGSTASQSLTSDGWKQLIKRRNDDTGSSSYYVKGHLLNNHLGGPGDTWDNLTPLTQIGNNRSGDSMYYAFEKKVKAAVLDDKRSVTNFEVVATYDAPNRSTEISEINTHLKQPSLSVAEKKRLQAIRSVIEEEQHIPTRVDCKAKLGKGKGASADEPLNVPVDNKFQTVPWGKYKVNA
jgi:hypothetical protein